MTQHRVGGWILTAAVFAGWSLQGAGQINGAENDESAIAAKLIPRQVLFGNPNRAGVRVSPNGAWISFLSPVEGVMNVWVAPVDDLDSAEPVTEDKIRGIRSYSWAYTGDHILYTQDKNGDENFHVFATDVKARETKNLTEIDGVQARVMGTSEEFPTEILVGLNDRVPQLHDIWRVNILTGEKELLQENPGFAGIIADDEFRIRLALRFSPRGGIEILKREEDGNWSDFMSVGPEDAMTFGPAGFDKAGQTLYLIDSRDRDTAALATLNLDTNEEKVLAEDPRADVGAAIVHPTKRHIQAASFTFDRRKWKILDESIADDFEFLRKLDRGEFEITSRTLDDNTWVIAYIADNGPVKYYLYDRESKDARFLFNNRDDLEDYQLVEMHPEIIKSRDGLDLVSYLSLPPGSDADGDGRPSKPVPLVLDVHGGPWSRDGWGYNPSHQWLANRGYAVLSVNFRGSTGFGKNFINAGNREWAGSMHNDLLDAVQWAVDEKITQDDQVAIMGGSYGGYATLVGLTFTPEVFTCGVDIVGPSSLVTLLENVPPYWVPVLPMMKDRVGDWSTDEGREKLLERSPLTKVDQIKRPLLIGQGANDPRVKQLESDQIVKAMEAKQIPVTYVVYPDEGHGFARPENRLSFFAVAEGFLAEHLGGRYQPIGGDFEGASIEVPSGAAGVPGLEKALQEKQVQPESGEGES